MQRFFSAIAPLAAGACLVACGPTSPSAGYPASGYASNPGVPPPPVERYSPHPAKQVGSALLYLPGRAVRELVQFEVVDGMAIYQGDIMLGPVTQLAFRYGLPPQLDPNKRSAVTTNRNNRLWPGGIIPYEIDATVTPKKREYILWAVAKVNNSALTVRPRLPHEKDYIQFTESGGSYGCSAYLGRVGGAQAVRVRSCARGSVIHEVLHAAGFYHEQSRNDRDNYVTIMWDEMFSSSRSAFEKSSGRSRDIGPYDYGSVMHYSAKAFSRTGRPTIVTKVPGARIGQRKDLSPLDRAAIATLYSGAPPPPAPTSPPAQPAPTPPSTPPKTPGAAGSYSGNYTSTRGPVACRQNGQTVSCSYPGGSMLCAIRGNQLDCGWLGGGQGRAMFTRQNNGTLAGTYGDLLSTTGRGRWDLVPAGKAPPPTAPPSQPPPASSQTNGSLNGNFQSSRGSMTCAERGNQMACNFNEQGTPGRLDCTKDASGTTFTCTWATFFPRPGAGRARFRRSSASGTSLTGTWGNFTAETGGGNWTISP